MYYIAEHQKHLFRKMEIIDVIFCGNDFCDGNRKVQIKLDIPTKLMMEFK